MTSGHKYLRIARELSVSLIRSILPSDAIKLTDVLPALSSRVRLIPRDELKKEEEIKVVKEYHVYFFEGSLSPEEQRTFLNEVAGFFQQLKSSLMNEYPNRIIQSGFPFGGVCGEFEAFIPVGDTSWCEAYLETGRRFSRQVRRIISFQGARFPM